MDSTKGFLFSLNELPQRHLLPLGGISAATLARKYPKYRLSLSESAFLGSKMVKPDVEALEFYLFNHLVGFLQTKFTPHERLPDVAAKVVELYSDILVRQATRLFYYTTLICVRESRHLAGWKESLNWSVAENAFPGINALFELVKGSGSSVAVDRFVETEPVIPLANLAGGLEFMFFKGKYSGGYGGPPWGEVAKTLRRFVLGETSAETFVDTAYTLAHNNGPIFNKGMLYNGYSSEFVQILDVQRAGQIPELVCGLIGYGTNLSEATSTEVTRYPGEGHWVEQHSSLLREFREEFPTAWGPYVDWYAVDKLGAVSAFSTQKKYQQQAHGVPEHAKEKPSAHVPAPIESGSVNPVPTPFMDSFMQGAVAAMDNSYKEYQVSVQESVKIVTRAETV